MYRAYKCDVFVTSFFIKLVFPQTPFPIFINRCAVLCSVLLHFPQGYEHGYPQLCGYFFTSMIG